ncbi:hypothetical protein D3C85_1123460 [compost metagenome]
MTNHGTLGTLVKVHEVTVWSLQLIISGSKYSAIFFNLHKYTVKFVQLLCISLRLDRQVIIRNGS